MDIVAFAFAAFGFIAFVRVEKLIKRLKQKGLLDETFKAD